MAYKGTFAQSLEMIPDALKWAEEQDISELRSFLTNEPSKPLYCFASGGSFSPMEYAAMLYESNMGLAKALTPLSMSAVSDNVLQASKIMLMTSSGKGCDEITVAKRAAQTNPHDTYAIVRNYDDENKVVKILGKTNARWHAYDWLVKSKSFIATVDTICKFGLFYRAFTGSKAILDKSQIDLNPESCFTYGPRVEGDVPTLGNIRNYIVLYNGWSKPVATDFESKMIECGLASVQLCDYRNFCHGRFIFLSKHIQDSALVLLVTPRERKFIESLFYGVTWRDKKDVFPKETPIVKIETNLDSPLATIDLLVKMNVCFDQIAKSFDDEPCSPTNPSGIDKRFPKNTPF